MRELRKLQHLKGGKKEFSVKPAKLVEGEEKLILSGGKPLRYYIRRFGKVWWSNYTHNGDHIVDRDLDVGRRLNVLQDINTNGAYQMDDADIVDTDGYQTGVLKTRQILCFGYNATINANAGATTTVDALTVNGAANGLGYRMIRAGKVTGVSVQYDVPTTGGGTFKATVQKNGTNQSMVASGTVASADEGAASTANAFTVAAGDQINVELELEETAIVAPIAVDDIAVIVEFES